MSLVDENAFGLLVAFHDLEDVEYASEREAFVARFQEFREAALEHAATTPLGPALRVLDLGHALYFELADGEQTTDPVGWLRALRLSLGEREFAVTAVLSHGGRWGDDSGEPEVRFGSGSMLGVRASLPSEPLRRALYAEAAAHGPAGDDGWGPGLYVDSEAIEALAKSLKNAPTPLQAAGATFYRIGR